MDRLSFSFKHPKLVPGGLFASSSRKRFSKNDDDVVLSLFALCVVVVYVVVLFCTSQRERERERPTLSTTGKMRATNSNGKDESERREMKRIIIIT